jgi:tetratricopeptide (TPR) repeat protein
LHTSLAKLMEQSGNFDSAAQHFEKALAMDGRNLDALLSYAHLLDRQGQLPQALEKYQAACQFHPQSSAAFNDLGLCLARMNRLEESLGPLNHATTMDPQRQLYRNNLATVLVELGRVDEAIQQLRAAHGDAIAHYNVGYLLQKRGQAEAAINHFAIAARIDPTLTAAQRWAENLSGAVQQAAAYQTPNAVPQQPQGYGEVTAQPSSVGQRYQDFYQQQQ